MGPAASSNILVVTTTGKGGNPMHIYASAQHQGKQELALLFLCGCLPCSCLVGADGGDAGRVATGDTLPWSAGSCALALATSSSSTAGFLACHCLVNSASVLVRRWLSSC